MRLEQLAYLLEISKRKSMSIAAEKLHITQQSLSISIKTLEIELDMTLLNRSYRGVTLTDEGKEIACLAKRVLADVERTKEKLSCKNTGSVLTGILNIYIMPAFNNNILIEIINIFAKKYPLVKIQITESGDSLTIFDTIKKSSPQKNIIGLLNYGFDEPDCFPPVCDELTFHLLQENHLLAAVSKDSSLTHKKSISMRDFLKQPIVMYSSINSGENWLYKIFDAYGKPNIAMLTDNPQLSSQFIAANMGVGALPSILSDSSAYVEDNIVLIPFKEKISIVCGYILPAKSEPSPILRSFIALLEESYKDYS